MTINLQKGQTITLEKEKYDLKTITMGLGWDVAQPSGGGGFLGRMFNSSSAEFDLDGFALLLGANDKLQSSGDVIYYGNLKLTDGTVEHSGDNLTGQGEGDDEQIIIHLESLSLHYQKIILAVSIYKAAERSQHFGLVKNAFVRSVDAKGEEMVRYSLSLSDEYEGKSSMLLGELYRRGANWHFRALGNALNAGRIQEVVRPFT